MNDVEKLIDEVLNGEDNADIKLSKLFGKKLSYNNAASYIAGMKLFIKTMQNLYDLGDPNDYEKFSKRTFNKDNTQTVRQTVYLTPNEAASPTLIMQKMGFDPLLFEVVKCEVDSGDWDVTMKMVNSQLVNGKVVKSSDPLTITNYRYGIKLTVKPLACELTFPQVLEAFKVLPPIDDVIYDYKPIPSLDGLLLELGLMDLHLGKLAWGEESGADYDLKIAISLAKKSVLDLISLSQPYHSSTERILFPVGQDFYHFDTPKVTTTSGTQLNTDTRWQKMFRKGIELLVWSIETLRKIAPVEVIWVPGNHDQMLSYAAVVGLAQRYYNTSNVNVDLIATPRKYRLFGKNLLGFSHGEKEKNRIDGLMQIEAPDLWGQSIFREFHMGHLHSEHTKTNNGIVFRRISSITAPDAYHSEHGFLGAVRQTQGFIWHKDLGLRSILNSNVSEKVTLQ